MKRVAVIGAGRIGKVHFRNCLLNENVEIAWIVEANVDFAHQLLNRYSLRNSGIKVVHMNDIEQVWNDKR